MTEYMEYNESVNFLHHQHSSAYLYGREVVFGMQDGMVSLLGALTGIAAGSNNHFVIILSGFSIIFTASLSMAIGTYNGVTTEKKIEERILEEERKKIKKSPIEEKKEIEIMFCKDGWSKEIAMQMAEHAAQDNELMFHEMAYRELHISPQKTYQPIKKSLIMLLSWIGGGLFPLSPYLFLTVSTAMFVSIITTVIGLFMLGAAISKFVNQKLLKSGVEMTIIGSLAMLVGLITGRLVDWFIQH